MSIRRILNEQFRVNPLYTLREWNDLTHHEKKLISGLHDEEDVYGVFSPGTPGSQLTIKLAYHELALVYLHLSRSSLLPHYLSSLNADSFNQAIAQLVLDQVLEIKWEEKYVSGVHATEAIFGKSVHRSENIPGFIAGLSNQGIEYVLHLNNGDMRTIANRLYTYNTLPWDPCLKRNFNEKTDTRDFVFSASHTLLISLLNKEWHLINDPGKDHWLGWSRRNFPGQSPTVIDKETYKLYISPVMQDLPKMMNLVLPVLTSSEAFSFKIGNGIHGLLRPDKMVVYFNSRSSLLQVAEELKNKLGDFTVQGVPFTAQIDEKGILSWGVDPPGSDVLEAIEGGSWRCRVTDQIALAIIQSRDERIDHQQAMEFIGSKLFVAGIDPFNWMPLN